MWQIVSQVYIGALRTQAFELSAVLRASRTPGSASSASPAAPRATAKMPASASRNLAATAT